MGVDESKLPTRPFFLKFVGRMCGRSASKLHVLKNASASSYVMMCLAGASAGASTTAAGVGAGDSLKPAQSSGLSTFCFAAGAPSSEASSSPSARSSVARSSFNVPAGLG